MESVKALFEATKELKQEPQPAWLQYVPQYVHTHIQKVTVEMELLCDEISATMKAGNGTTESGSRTKETTEWPFCELCGYKEQNDDNVIERLLMDLMEAEEVPEIDEPGEAVEPAQTEDLDKYDDVFGLFADDTEAVDILERH